nr:MAG TPA: hypothetical protein [Caudoviricetes sp.]
MPFVQKNLKFLFLGRRTARTNNRIRKSAKK